MIKIRVEETSYRDVNLSLSEAKKVTISYLYQTFDIPYEAYLKPTKESSIQSDFLSEFDLVVDEEQWGGQHSWYTEKVVRRATNDDVRIVNLIKEIKNK